ncbi:hypothetical protein [Bosea sp. (in: a-proteobacteria)]|uniref:hypothetical protein n=1 Tax=Bosea sp. (in: a-proteobacteria) TaxID=1871050 RepID=UPI003B3B1852
MPSDSVMSAQDVLLAAQLAGGGCDLAADVRCLPFSRFPGCTSEAGNLPVIARSEAEALRTLDFLGGGTLGAGFGETYMGSVMMPIRNGYYAELERVAATIARRQAELGPRLNDPAAMRSFVDWARGQRLRVARLYRIPMGPGAMLGAELRDIREYGWGGRSMSNLEARQLQKYGRTGDDAVKAILNSVDRPNAQVTARAARAARVLRGGGAVLIVGGALVTGYEIYEATPAQRPMVVKRAAATTAASTAASAAAVGLAVMLGATGVGLIVVGIVAGVAASYGTEQVFFAEKPEDTEAFRHRGMIGVDSLVCVGGPR